MSVETLRYFGCHVSAAGGLEQAILNANELQVNTIQIHANPPQRWNSKPSAKGVEEKFLELKKDSVVKKVFFHGIYLINLATPNPQQYHLSQLSLIHSLDLLARMNGEGVIFHMGSLKDESDETIGYKRVAEGINNVLEKSPPKAKLILEVAAGGGKIIGDRIEELATIYEMIEDKQRVGFGLDTQHLWASGYDLQNELETFIKDVERVLDLKKVWAIHLNDSKTEKGSRKDRHENIGDGLIGTKALKAFFLHPKLAEIPFILETPGMKSVETAKIEVRKLEDFLKGG